MADMAPQSDYAPSYGRKPAYKAKVKTVLGEFKKGALHSGSKKGPKVTDRKQAIAIALNQAHRTILGNG